MRRAAATPTILRKPAGGDRRSVGGAVQADRNAYCMRSCKHVWDRGKEEAQSREDMTLASEIPPPSRCFCQIAMDELTGWARKKYLERMPTIQLLTLARNPREKEAVGILALLDVPDDEVIRVMTPLTPSGCNILACRNHVKKWIADMLEMHPVSQAAAP